MGLAGNLEIRAKVIPSRGNTTCKGPEVDKLEEITEGEGVRRKWSWRAWQVSGDTGLELTQRKWGIIGEF